MSCVYFIRPVGQDGPIKVGFSIYPQTRLHVCNSWSPVPLEIVAVLDLQGEDTHRKARGFERRFHQRYADYRLHSEWFAAHPLILRDIELIRNRRFRIRSLAEAKPAARRPNDWRRLAPEQRVSA